MQVLAVTADAMLIVYTMRTRGTYDGNPFTNAEALSALWLRRKGSWQNAFLHATIIMEGQENT